MGTVDSFLKLRHQYVNALVVSIFVFLVYFSLWYLSNWGIAYLILGGVVIGLIINIYRFHKWRCPECNTFLGNNIYIENCPKCDCSLIGEKIIDTSNSKLKRETYSKDSIQVKTKIEIPETLKNYEKLDILN